MSRGTRRIESDYVRDDRRSRVSEDVIVDGRVYLGSTTAKNFSYREINDWMYEYGKVLDVVFFDRHILVQFDRDSEARKAIEREKGKSFKGTRFDIRPAYSSDGSMSRSETHHSKSPRDSNFERGARDISPGFRERDRSPLDKDRYIKESSQDFRVNDRRRLLSKDNIRPNIRPDLSDELAVVPVRNPSQSLPNPKNVPSEKPSFDAAIVVMSGNLLNYAEIIETKLQRLVALTTHIIVLKEEAHANACIDDLEKKGVLYAFLVNQMNEKHASCTLRILYGLGQEHRNMPLASALSYVARNFEDYQKQNLEPKSAAPKTTFDPSRIPPAFLPPDDKIIYELHLLADSRMLTLEELNEVDDFIQKRIQMLDEAEGQLANKSNCFIAKAGGSEMSLNIPLPDTNNQEFINKPQRIEETAPFMLTHTVQQGDDNFEQQTRVDPFLVRMSRPCSFYAELTLETNKRRIQQSYCFENQTLIPNRLKQSTQTRKLSLHRLNTGNILNIESVIPFPQLSVFIHVANGKGSLHLRNRYDNRMVDHALPARSSWEMTNIQMNDYVLAIQPLNPCLIIALEELLPEPPHVLQQPLHISNREKDNQDALNEGQSIIFSKKENHRVVFIASRYGLGTDKRHHLIKAVIKEQRNGILFNEIVCPRVAISNIDTPLHGLGTADLESKLDEYLAHTTISNLIKGAVVVGMNPYAQLKKIGINLDLICGFRNLERNRTCQLPSSMNRVQITVQEDRQKHQGITTPVIKPIKWHLDQLICGVVQDRRHYNLQDPLQEVYHVERIYNFLESTWIDDVDAKEPSSEGSEKNLQSSQLPPIAEKPKQVGENVAQSLEEEPGGSIKVHYSSDVNWQEDQKQLQEEQVHKIDETSLSNNQKDREETILYNEGIDMEHRYPWGQETQLKVEDLANLRLYSDGEVLVPNTPRI